MASDQQPQTSWMVEQIQALQNPADAPPAMPTSPVPHRFSQRSRKFSSRGETGSIMSRKRSMKQRLNDIEQWDLPRKSTVASVPLLGENETPAKSKKSVSSARIDLLAGNIYLFGAKSKSLRFQIVSFLSIKLPRQDALEVMHF